MPDETKKPTDFPAGKEFKVDLSEWGKSMEAFTEWNEAANAGDFAKLQTLMAQVVKEMPYTGDVNDPLTFRKLTPQQFKAASLEVSKAIGNFFRGL